MHINRFKARPLMKLSFLVLSLGVLFIKNLNPTHAEDHKQVTDSGQVVLTSMPVNQNPRLSLEGGGDWINTDRPIHLDKLRGKIVLLDFWTYCCINCHHVLPDLAKLEAKYKNQLVVIGVHSAKFPAERITSNIRKKVNEYNIKHPVINDANMILWRRFGVEGWPTLAVIDPTGKLVYGRSGEGQFEALDEVIGTLVRQHKQAGDLDESPVEFFPEREKTHVEGLLFPGKVLADQATNRLYISDTGHNRVVITDLTGQYLTSIGSGEEGLANGSFEKAKLNRPQGLCLVGETLYVADTENHAIRAIDLKAKSISTVAGNGSQAPYGAAGGQGIEAALNSPWDLLLLPGTRILAVAMAGPHQIWQLNLDNNAIRAWAGSGNENIVNGPLASAAFAQPSGLATDGRHLFIADSEVSGVRSIDLTTADALQNVETIVGIGLFGFGDIDGQGPRVRLQHCLGLTYGHGKLFIADSYNNKIKTCDPATKSVHTWVGVVTPGVSDKPALFSEPGGLSIAGNNLYVADTNNHQIRVVPIDTKQVRTLKLTGLSAPRIKQIPTFPNAKVVTVDSVSIAPGKTFTISLSPELERGYELNAEAPMTYLVETPDNPLALSTANPATGGRIEPPKTPFTLTVPLANEPKAGETIQLKVSLGALVCLPNTLCTSKNFVWNIPVKFAEGAPKHVSIGVK